MSFGSAGERPGWRRVCSVRPLDLMARAVLAAWCVLGVGYTARVLSRYGAAEARTEAEAAVVGLPLRHAPTVAAVRRLLATTPRPAGDADLVILPRGADPVAVAYVRQQLAYHAYPRRVDVVIAGADLQLDSGYAAVVAAPGLSLRAPWAPAGRYAGFTLYAREAR